MNSNVGNSINEGILGLAYKSLATDDVQVSLELVDCFKKNYYPNVVRGHIMHHFVFVFVAIIRPTCSR